MTNNKTQLAVTTDKLSFTQEQEELIRNTIAPTATQTELALFLYQAKRTGLDPLNRQIYFVKRGEKVTIQTSIDGLRTIAERGGSYAGNDDAIYDSEDAKHPNKATVSVYRIIQGQRVPFTSSARWSEYAPYYNGKLGAMWEKMPYLMLAKCAEALALRKAFPQDLSGLYTTDEMNQAEEGHVQELNPKEMREKIDTLSPVSEEKQEEVVKVHQEVINAPSEEVQPIEATVPDTRASNIEKSRLVALIRAKAIDIPFEEVNNISSKKAQELISSVKN